MLKKVFRFLFSVCLIVLGIGMSLYPAVRSEKIHMEAISYQKEVDNAYKQNKEQKKKKESDPFYQSIKKYNEDIYKNGQKDLRMLFPIHGSLFLLMGLKKNGVDISRSRQWMYSCRSMCGRPKRTWQKAQQS